MPQTPQLSILPTELLLHVVGFLSNHDLSSFSRLSRQFHWRLFHLLFDSAIADRSDSRSPEKCLTNLFFHAVKHDSTNIAQYLIYSTYGVNLNGYDLLDNSMYYSTLHALAIFLRLSMSSFILDRSRAAPKSASSAMSPTKAPASGGFFSLASLRTSPSFILPCWPTRQSCSGFDKEWSRYQPGGGGLPRSHPSLFDITEITDQQLKRA